MKVLLINGSPHEKGCTYTALTEITAVLNQSGIDTEIMHIAAKPVVGCMGCGACKKLGKCVQTDIVNAFLEKAKEADGFIFGSPVHFAGASGAITSFMDRAFYAGAASVQNKPAAAIASCRRGGASATFDQLNKYFAIRSMPIVTSQYWNMVHGNTPDEVKQDAEGMQTMRTLAQNMVWMLKCIEAGKAAGIDTPTYETPKKTNFIR